MNKLLASVPGMSLTTEPGNRPWEQPPRLNTVTEVVDFYSDSLTSIKSMNAIVGLLKEEVPITTIANSLIKANMMKGEHSIDTGMLVMPVIVELIKSVASIYDVGYITTPEDSKKMTKLSPEAAREVIEEASTKMKEVAKEEPEVAGGLMSRGKK
jgi:hypothetical protein